MEATINVQSGERLSFYKLFKEKNYRVLIPIIQRDYAQGRKNKTEVRETFLSALYQYLEENKPNRDLDFVYGSLSKVENKTDFIPLDGQQRLTTLFLLHWYLYQIQDDKNVQNCQDFKSALFKDQKSMFTYETRTSSSDFCDALMDNDFDFNNLLDIDQKKEITKENQLSKTIENSTWYFLSWKQDPTIQSMLTMLDAIHNKFVNKKEFFDRLLNIENPIITFQFLNLKDFKLTDDLYIKMNSRGKPLTSFENFKAKFEQYLEKLTTNRTFELTFNNTKEEVSLNKYFSYNIDAKWANLFWNYRELVGDKSIFDEELKNFIRVIFANQYAIDVEIKGDRTDETFEFLLGTASAKKRNDYTDDISFYKYDELKALSIKSVLYLIDAFDALVNGNDKIKNHLSDNYKFYFNASEEVYRKDDKGNIIYEADKDGKEKTDENNNKIPQKTDIGVFPNALKYSFVSNQERIMFHAYIRFLIQNKGNTIGIEQWMRVIHNLAYNTIIDGAVEFARAIKSIEKMLPQSNDILNYIIINNIEGFASWQILEEKIKAHLILKTNNDWKTKIEEAEKHDCFEGQIGFILEFSGILDYYNTNDNCNWPNEKDYFDKFVNYIEKAIAIFNDKKNKEFDKSHLWEKAVLTKGDYLIVASSYRKNLLTTDRNTRDFSWKRLLRITSDDKQKKQYAKQVFDDNLFDKNDIQKSLENICKTKTNDWRDFFISCDSLISYCKQGFIRFQNKNDILLYGESQSNHLHRECYTYYLWKTVFEKDKNLSSFFNKKYYYYEVKSIDDTACIAMEFCHNKINYEIDICWNAKESKYEIHFYKTKGNKEETDYSQDIQELLQNFAFTWNQDKYLFSTHFDKVKEIIESIIKKLKE